MSHKMIGNSYEDLGYIDDDKIYAPDGRDTFQRIDSDGDIRDQYGNVVGRIDEDGDVRDHFGNVVGRTDYHRTQTSGQYSGSGYVPIYSPPSDSLLGHQSGILWRILLIASFVLILAALYICLFRFELVFDASADFNMVNGAQSATLIGLGAILLTFLVPIIKDVDHWKFIRFGTLLLIGLGLAMGISSDIENDLWILCAISAAAYVCYEVAYFTRKY